jgi:ubiquinone/menaquinone biosynthesis C-methylase UbiE
MASKNTQSPIYKYGHHQTVLRSHKWRTAANSAAFLLPHLQPSHKILDLGCGPGTITTDLALLVPEGSATGIDFSPSVIEQAQASATEKGISNVHFQVGNVQALEFADDTFDVAYCHQVLQHVADPIGMLREMWRIVKPGGIVVARESDFKIMTWYPDVPALREYMEFYPRLVVRNGGDSEAGRKLHVWAQNAGIEKSKVECSSSNWLFTKEEDVKWWSGMFADRILKSEFKDVVLETGMGTEADLRRWSGGWREWGEKEDAWFLVAHGEILCRK